jgi:hypothetical protein
MGKRTRYRRNPTIIIGGTTIINNFYLTGSYLFNWQTFADGDTDPSVDGGEHFKTANTGATVITNFDDPANEPGADGQKITILFQDTNTTIQHNANINLQGGIDFGASAVGDIMHLVYDGSRWEENGRNPK